MALEKYLVVRPDGQVEKSKPVDKIDTKSSSFFAALPSVTPSKGFMILGGYAVILRNFVSISDTEIRMNIGGSHETSALPVGYWNTAAFSINNEGVVLKTEGTPASTKNGVVPPVFPSGTLPICLVTYQDNGSGSAGTIKDLEPVDIIDRRPFFYGSYNQPLEYTNAISDFKVDPTLPPSTNLIVRKGKIYFSNGQLVEIPETVLPFGVEGTYEVPAMPASNYSIGLICLTQYSTIQVVWSSPNPNKNLLVRPTLPRGVVPLAAITVQDDGRNISGSIKVINASDIEDSRPTTAPMLGIVRADDLSYVKVQPLFPPDKRVVISGGVVYPSAGLFIDFQTTVIDFGPGGSHQLDPLPVGYWKRILLSLDAAGNTLIFYSPASVNRSALTNPVIPKNVIPLAFVDVQDDFEGAAGTIRSIQLENIRDIRPWLGASGSGAGGVTSASSVYSDYLNTSSWEQGFYEDFQDDELLDLANTTGDVDVLVDNNCTLQPSQKLTTINAYDNSVGLSTIERALVIVEANDLSGLQIELTNNGGLDWFVVQEKGVLEFTTSGIDLRLRITNIGSSEVVITNFGVFYNDDEISPSFLFSNERLPLFQTILGSDAEVSGNLVTLKDGRQYPVGENALMVFKNGYLLPKDSTLTTLNSYREYSMTQIQLESALDPSDRLNLVMPAGYFGQTVAQFQSTLNNLVASQHITDGLVRFPFEGTNTDLQTSINNDLEVGDGGSIILETQVHTISTPITILDKPTYIYAKSQKATLQCSPTYNLSLLNVQDNSEFQLAGVTIKASGFASSALGVSLTGSAPDVVISNCIFENLGVAISATSGCTRLIIKDCKFINCGKAVEGSTNVRLINCLIDGDVNGSEAVLLGDDSSITNSTVKNFTTFGVRVFGSAAVLGNSISACGVGVHLNSTSQDTIVSDNLVKACTSGIQVDSHTNVVKANICKSNVTGILLNGAENMIESNVVTDNTSDGIVIGASATGNEIGNNVLVRNP
jgi:parallel beta-helix repeat protein